MNKTEFLKKLNISQNEALLYLKMAFPSDKEVYDDEDMGKVAMVMTLKRLGLDYDKISCFMECPCARMTLLNQQRILLLDKLHDQQKLLDEMDYLIHDLKGRDMVK